MLLRYIARRIVIIIPILFLISLLSFFIIQLPPGDFLSTMLQAIAAEGETVTAADEARIELLRARYGLDRPFIVQYLRWITGIILRGDFGYSFQWNRAVSAIIWSRIGLTLVLSISSLIFTLVVAFPIGFYSAVKQYSIGDYIATFFGFLGLAIPNFLLALVLLYLGFEFFGVVLGGLYAREFIGEPWTWAKIVSLLQHIWIPVIVIGTAGTAGLIRILRNNLLDELQKPYVLTARAKGVPATKLLLKYPVRIAIIPFLSTVGWMLPAIFSGEAIVALVLTLPTIGPVLFNSLLEQDMYLAGSLVFLLAVLTVIGTLISDILLAIVDPRIRYE